MNFNLVTKREIYEALEREVENTEKLSKQILDIERILKESILVYDRDCNFCKENKIKIKKSGQEIKNIIKEDS
jgi:hypothetical protein